MGLSNWVVLQQNKSAIYWGVTAAFVIHPTTRSVGWAMTKFGVRATGNVAIASTRALLGTTLVRGGTTTFGGALARGGAAVALGYAIGATVGSGISYAVWGEKGARDALDLYSGGVSVDEYFSTVGKALQRTF